VFLDLYVALLSSDHHHLTLPFTERLLSCVLVPRLGFQKGQQVGVDPILKRGCEAVRCARIIDFLRALDEPGRFLSRILDGNDLVVLAVHDKSRDIDLLEVLSEISL
jgi:hypothetical protein